MSQVIIVGNGPSVLNHKLGSKIDSFDYIVRFNNFKIKGYEEYVGSRTDILCRRACDDVTLHSPDDFDHVLVFVTYCLWTMGMQQVARQVKSFYGENCTIIDVKICKEIGEKIGLDQPNKEWASVGVLAIDYLIGLYGIDNITIHGFDFLKPNKDGIVEHYFPKPPKDAKYHNSVKEEKYIKSLNLRNLVNETNL